MRKLIIITIALVILAAALFIMLKLKRDNTYYSSDSMPRKKSRYSDPVSVGENIKRRNERTAFLNRMARIPGTPREYARVLTICSLKQIVDKGYHYSFYEDFEKRDIVSLNLKRDEIIAQLGSPDEVLGDKERWTLDGELLSFSFYLEILYDGQGVAQSINIE